MTVTRAGQCPPTLAVVIPAWNERPSLEVLIPALHQVLPRLGVSYEIIVADNASCDGTVPVCERAGVRLVQQTECGYGGALLAGFQATSADFVVTMDADLSHPPAFITTFWTHRDQGDVFIASRYVRGGHADMQVGRYLLSRILNIAFRSAFLLPTRDVSSGFRMYRRAALDGLRFDSRQFDVLEEIICLQRFRKLRILELPFHYHFRHAGESHARILAFGVAYLRTIVRLWRRRVGGDF